MRHCDSRYLTRGRRASRQAAVSSVRYRYSVALLTPRYLAMSLPVWPSAFIRLAVAMCSASAIFRGHQDSAGG